MNLGDAYSRIVFDIGTADDTSGRALNPQATNKIILIKLLDQMRTYANVTKGIQDVYSLSLNQQISFVAAPSLALRSRGYLFAYIISNGTIFPMDFRSPGDVFPNFRVNPVNGITNWIMPWHAGHTDYLSGFPNTSISALTTTLTGNISSSDTTIPVTSTSGQINNFGRIIIGTEKILYEYKNTLNFYQCVRGVEQTTAASHSSGDTVTQNNVILMYARLPITFAAETNDTISAATLAQVLEPCDEHMQGIIKATDWELLTKIDVDRAALYKSDFEVMYEQYRKDISAGHAKNRANVNIRSAYPGNEMGVPYGTNLLY